MPETPGVLELTIPDQWKAAPLALIEAGTIGLAEGPIRPMPTGEHWLRFDGATRAVIGCHCGFVAAEADDGWGDSVVAHLLDVGARKAQDDADEYRIGSALMRPHTARLHREVVTFQREHALPRTVLRIVVPADWPESFDGAQVVGVACARGEVTEPTVEYVPPAPVVPERAPMRPRTTSNPDLWGKR